ncbi:MAG: hypothetical protein II956_14055 [Bacteroidales bacterium]|nr:hypothetical protein [Bacteroidales bacterium]
MKRTLRDIETEIVDVQERSNTLSNELRELKDKLHSLKEEKFEVANNIRKGDIIQDTDGVRYCYKGLSKEWGGYFLLVSKITKKGLQSKRMISVLRSKFKLQK